MARHSLLTEEPETEIATPQAPPVVRVPRKAASHIHIGGYYSPADASIVAFRQLAVELRKTKQEMLHEAITDYLAKAQAMKAFR